MPGGYFFKNGDSDKLEHAQRTEAKMVGETQTICPEPRDVFPGEKKTLRGPWMLFSHMCGILMVQRIRKN